MKNLKTYENFTNSINEEYTNDHFTLPEIKEMTSSEKEIINKYFPNVLNSSENATDKLKSHIGGRMFVHVYYKKYQTDDGVLFYHCKQYWLKNNSPKASLMTVKLNDNLIGQAIVDTDILLDDTKSFRENISR